MARISAPEYEIESLRYEGDDSPSVRTINRAYARINKKFEPIGWFVVWSDGLERVILDADVPSQFDAYQNFSKYIK